MFAKVKMSYIKMGLLAGASALTMALAATPAKADYYTQCNPALGATLAIPEYGPDYLIKQDSLDSAATGTVADTLCMQIVGTDGFVRMADDEERRLYMFGFSDVPWEYETPTGNDCTAAQAATNPLTCRPKTNYRPNDETMLNRAMSGALPASAIVMKEGQEVYLTLHNVPFTVRPDLFDPHSVHFHGFANASVVFDGVPENSITPWPLSSMTYYYKPVDPGTYVYHCHVEAAEHMQMGMLGNLYVLPAQNELPTGSMLGAHTHTKWDSATNTGDRYVFNDGDGSTRYDIDYPIQIHTFDPVFHEQSETVQPLRFAEMEDSYMMLNGRGYPDSVAAGGPVIDNGNDLVCDRDIGGLPVDAADPQCFSQPVSSKMTVEQGKMMLMRLSNLSTTDIVTITSPDVALKIVGKGQRQLRGPGGNDFSFTTHSIQVGNGEMMEVLIDTTNVLPGKYFVYTSNLHFLSNDDEDFGGIMTEIEVTAPVAPLQAAALGGGNG